mmetsp:Transcript_2316/g.4089  ORF Transcript_2316/g.4089 Transcript_2316/m.4089 type:complete len:262 (+) Transcript_2316:1396-2181(+)
MYQSHPTRRQSSSQTMMLHRGEEVVSRRRLCQSTKRRLRRRCRRPLRPLRTCMGCWAAGQPRCNMTAAGVGASTAVLTWLSSWRTLRRPPTRSSRHSCLRGPRAASPSAAAGRRTRQRRPRSSCTERWATFGRAAARMKVQVRTAGRAAGAATGDPHCDMSRCPWRRRKRPTPPPRCTRCSLPSETEALPLLTTTFRRVQMRPAPHRPQSWNQLPRRRMRCFSSSAFSRAARKEGRRARARRTERPTTQADITSQWRPLGG